MMKIKRIVFCIHTDRYRYRLIDDRDVLESVMNVWFNILKLIRLKTILILYDYDYV